MRIASVNVNGIRAAYRRGMGEWLETRRPDVLLLQEIRATDEILEDHLGHEWTTAHGACEIKGRAGVAVASRRPATAVRVGLGNRIPAPPHASGRWGEMALDQPGRDPPRTGRAVCQPPGTATEPGPLAR